MQDFTAAKNNLGAARASLATAEAAQTAARNTLRRLAAEHDALARSFHPDDRAARLAQENQARNLEDAKGRLDAAVEALASARQALNKAVGNFEPFSDPRTGLAQLTSDCPITLLPVRVETRFAPATESKGAHQLWVRVYPDDCWIDSFEPTLSSDELANAKQYWMQFWRAGGIEDDQRAAWRSLVAAHGSGRANYILKTFQPVSAPPPTKIKASDVILVISSEVAPTAANAAALTAYWQYVWLADGDKTKIGAAYSALTGAVGGAHADELLKNYIPFNLADQPAPPVNLNTVALSAVFLIFAADPPVQGTSWSRAPRLTHFPDCFVVLAFNNGAQVLSAVGGPITLPVYVAPDPSVTPDETLHPDPITGELVVPDPLKWMVDFPAAVAAGMGLAIDITAEQTGTGFDRLLVIGVQLSATAEEGAAALGELLSHHAQSGSGLAIVSQGTPAHNADVVSGRSRIDDPDVSFEDRLHAPLFTLSADPTQKLDGQCLAEALGIDAGLLQNIHGADGEDQLQARAMQRLLWPATLGFWMDKLMTPVFSDETVANARRFFTSHVRGRGVVPTIRIGVQPYGVLPTTAFSRIGWLDASRDTSFAGGESASFLRALYALWRRVDADWQQMSSSASYVGKAGDAHQILLGIIGHHPDSVEFYSRYAESLSSLWNLLNLGGRGPALWPQLQQFQAAGIERLRALGYAGSAPELLQHFFAGTATLLGTIIDDRASSETTPIRAYTDDGRNYLQWLQDAVTTSLDAVAQEEGFTGDQSPRALLYLLARHALMLGYYDTCYELYRSAGFLTAQQLEAMKPEPAFIHVDATAGVSESRFAALYTTEPRITSNASMLVSDYITSKYTSKPEAAGLADQISALRLLKAASTSALERLLSEHIDTCSYRFDSWLLGLVAVQLEAMRAAVPKQQHPGTYLGAYAWLEDVRPNKAALTAAALSPEQLKQFPGAAPPVIDPANGGYVLAPSIPQAKTAAVLRSGYLANATSANAQSMSVNLSSDRVRYALNLLDGIRSGQSLGALLGYQFERGLHDDHGLAEVDQFVYPLRKAFPLVADSQAATQTSPGVPIEAIEARNVLDGRKLIAQIQLSKEPHYPFGWTTTPLPPANAAQRAAIDQEAERLLDAYDAVADLALAEGVHQAVQGNFDRLAGTLETYTTGNFPPDPEVVRTPAAGISVTNRVAVHFTPGLPPPANATPRATAEPALDDWLSRVLPPLDSVKCTVSWVEPISQAPRTRVVSLKELKLRPIDVLALVRPDDAQSMTELDDRVVSQVLSVDHPRPDAKLSIAYLAAPAGDVSIFAAAALIRSLRAVLVRSRPLRVTDPLFNSGAGGQPSAAATIDPARLSGPIAAYQQLSADLASYLATLDPLVTFPVANRAALLAGIDTFLDGAAALLERAARFAVPQAGWGFISDWKRRAFTDLVAAMEDLLARWAAALANFNSKLDAYNALPAATPDADRFRALRSLEIIVSTSQVALPPTPAQLLNLVTGKAQAFKNRRDQLQATTQTTDPSFAHLLTSVSALLPLSAFDMKVFTVTEFEDRVVTIAGDLDRALNAVLSAVKKRYAAASAALTEYASASDVGDQTAALTKAAKAMYGEDFVLYPEFRPTPTLGTEWTNAYGASTGGALLKYLSQVAQVEFAVDEWLTGVARVRPAMHAWEAATNFAAAFQTIDMSLTPVQFPFVATAPWVAMQYDPAYSVTSEHLLYTAHYPPAGFDAMKSQCGLLLDEWTETLPIATRTAGLTFNYDRPNSEAPQSWLIVTPASTGPAWQWDDLVGALNETLDLAKKRALEPGDIDPLTYARFLPATVSVATTYGITIAATLAAANGVYDKLRVRE